MSRMQPIFVVGLPDVAYTLIAYYKAMKCNVALVIRFVPVKMHKLFFSTDTSLTGKEVQDFYRSWFQIEFSFRDAKQFCGLTDSQARDAIKFDCTFTHHSHR